jgi:hypothetical protein
MNQMYVYPVKTNWLGKLFLWLQKNIGSENNVKHWLTFYEPQVVNYYIDKHRFSATYEQFYMILNHYKVKELIVDEETYKLTPNDNQFRYGSDYIVPNSFQWTLKYPGKTVTVNQFLSVHRHNVITIPIEGSCPEIIHI